MRKLKHTGGPNSKNRGEHSKKKKETEKKPKPSVTRPKPTQLMDPDHQNALEALDGSRSIKIAIQWLKTRGVGSGQNPPGPAPYIKGSNPVPLHFSLSFSFFSLLPLTALLPSPVQNPNPNFLSPTQNLIKS